MVDIFDEVDEDLRAERAQKLLKRHGGAVAAVGLLVVAAISGWQAWNWWEGRRAAHAAQAYIAAMSAADNLRTGGKESHADIAQSFAQVAAQAPEGYATLARLRAAASAADAGNLAAALALWDAVASDRRADRLLRDLAGLNWVQHQIDAGDPAVLEARLKPLTAPDNPWHALALEAQGLLDIRTGKTDAARAVFRRVAQDGTAPDGLRARANGLLNRLGG